MSETVSANVPIKQWTDGVPVEAEALKQLRNVAGLPIVSPHVAVMPDVHWGIGATIGSVIPTFGAIIPAAVGVDIGCGMLAARTTLTASQLPDNLHALRSAIESKIPHGRTHNGGKGDRGAWGKVPEKPWSVWTNTLAPRFEGLAAKTPALKHSNSVTHLGTLGSGNHFIELCLDEAQRVWIMLHSGSRGVGGRIGMHFIALAQQDMAGRLHELPDKDLAYFTEGAQHFTDYVEAMLWAQDFARANRELMLGSVIDCMRILLPAFQLETSAINCHHNYVAREKHFGRDLFITRKGAVSANEGELGIIPGSMGARSFIVRGKGNADSFCSCSHGAGRKMSRNAARKLFTLSDHIAATAGVECRKDAQVIDETPAAYKDIDAVLAAQSDLVEVVHTLKQVLCVKG
jgi:tRNA-splicing ligase RtcB (3'-phosphate/5'-hydroxy nucleic acid ligase)